MYLKLNCVFVQSYNKLDNEHHNNDQHSYYNYILSLFTHCNTVNGMTMIHIYNIYFAHLKKSTAFLTQYNYEQFYLCNIHVHH